MHISRRTFCLAGFAALVAPSARAAEPNTFVGKLQLEKLPYAEGDNTFKLLAPFTYIDAKGKPWTAPKGAVVNGASIPPSLWSIVGSPWSGKYPEAAVIHDHFCTTKSRPWKDVHRTFYDAMRANGVSEIRANAMYFTVYRFGPRWTDVEKNFAACLLHFGLETKDKPNLAHDQTDIVLIDGVFGGCFVPRQHQGRVVLEPKPDPAELVAAVERIESGKWSIADIEAQAQEGLKKRFPRKPARSPFTDILREIEVID
jgi:hypothetical protein